MRVFIKTGMNSGSNVCCYTGHVPADDGWTNLSTKNADLQHFRALCVATVDTAADTVRANIISANDVQAQMIIQSDPITAAIALHDPTVNIGFQILILPIEQYVGVIGVGGLSLGLQNGNNVSLDGTPPSGLRVGIDGWYQVSFVIGAPVATVNDIDIGLGINGDTSSAVRLQTVTITDNFGHISGSTLMNLVAGDVVQIFLIGTPPGTFGVNDPANAQVRLTVSRIGP